MRLASFDFVTAVAVVGAIDAVQGHDTVIPPLDLSQTVPKIAPVDLTDFDLDALMSVEIGPASPRADLSDIDLGEFSVEQLLALESRPANTAIGPQAEIAVAAFEDLKQVEVRAAEPDHLPSPLDLTGLALETLQDLQFGEDPLRTETPHRQLAALDLTSRLDKDDLNQIVLIDGSVEPSSADSSPYAAIHHDAISPGTAAFYVTPVNDAPVADAPVTVAPITVAPVKGAPITGAPITVAPVKGAPITGAPITGAPINGVPVNGAPVAIDDSTSGAEDSAITPDLLANDSDPDGDALTTTSVGPAGNGTVTLNADGTVTYTPDPDFNGVDSFDYTVSDGNGGTATATATVTVATINDAPVANDDSFAGKEDVAVTGNLLANDTDPDGDTLTVTAGTVTTANGGSVMIAADGSFTYTPAADFNGIDSFGYTVNDGNGGTATATATVDVVPVNDAPVAIDDSFAGTEDSAITAGLLTNDSDPDGDALTITALGPAGNGALSLNADGTIAYTPAPGFSGVDSFTYSVSDGNGATATATATVTVAPVNDAPVATDDSAAGTEDSAITLDLLANDSDPDGDALTTTSVGPAGNGTVTLNADGTVTYTPDPDFNGVDSFDYTVNDGNGGTATATATVDVAPVNDVPVAVNDLILVVGGTGTTYPVLANDSDPDGDPLSITSVTQGVHGTVTTHSDGTVTYTPTVGPGFFGIDSYSYTVSDGNGGSSTAAVTVLFATVIADLIVTGTAGSDILFGGAGNDTLDGKAGNDLLYGMGGNDTLIGGGGEDLLVGNAGADSLQGGAGDDTSVYAASTAGVTIDLGLGTGSGGDAEGDTFSSIEILIGSDYDDVLLGSGGNNTLDGGAGNDTLFGGIGDDILIGGAGADSLDGGAGSDTASYQGSRAGVSIDLSAGTGSGGDAEGDTLVNIKDIIGSSFNDLLIGDIHSNSIEGGAGDDVLLGGGGDDFLLGGGGNDVVDGGLGSDILQGLAGNDIFVFSPGTGVDADLVSDFTIGEDLIDLTGFGLAGMSNLSISTDGMGAALIGLPSDDSITLGAVDPALLTNSDFIF